MSKIILTPTACNLTEKYVEHFKDISTDANINMLKSETPMLLNIHLECFTMRKDLLTEKTKCQVLFCHKQNQPVKIESLFT